MADPIKILKTGKALGNALVKVFRGESDPSKWIGSKSKTPGRFFNPDKEYAKIFSRGEEGQRNLKSVDITEKDFNIGRKMADKIYGKDHCKGTDCNIILPKKYVDKVETEKFKTGGFLKQGYPKLAKKGWK